MIPFTINPQPAKYTFGLQVSFDGKDWYFITGMRYDGLDWNSWEYQLASWNGTGWIEWGWEDQVVLTACLEKHGTKEG